MQYSTYYVFSKKIVIFIIMKDSFMFEFFLQYHLVVTKTHNNNQYILNREDALKDCILTKNTAHLFSEIDSILKTIDINNIKNNYSENEIIYADYISMSFYLLKDNKQIYHSFLPESGKEWHILNLTQDYIIKNDTVNADKWKLFYDK